MAPIDIGASAHEAARWLGGAMLALSFVMLCRRRVDAVVNTCAAQSWLLAAASAWQGYVQDAPQLYATAAVAAGAHGTAMPLALHRIMRRLHIEPLVEPALGVSVSVVAGASLAALATLLVRPTKLTSQTFTHEDFALALSVVLLGLLGMVARRHALAQVVAFMSLENGVLLAASGAAGLPLALELCVASVAMSVAIAFGVLHFRIRDSFESRQMRHPDGTAKVSG